MTQLNVEVGPKRLELMHELVPAATTIAVLLNPTYPSAETQLRDMQAAARTLGLQVHVLRASNERENAFATLAALLFIVTGYSATLSPMPRSSTSIIT